MIKVEIRYFGMIAEAVSLTNEEILLEEESSTDAVLEYLYKKYAALKEKRFEVALNQKIITKNELITSACEIAILPPFAGG